MASQTKITISIDKDIVKTTHSLMNLALQDKNLTFFRLNTGSKQDWYRHIWQMGNIKVKEDFDKWKRQNEIQDNNGDKG